jgi:hypothetical protein
MALQDNGKLPVIIVIGIIILYPRRWLGYPVTSDLDFEIVAIPCIIGMQFLLLDVCKILLSPPPNPHRRVEAPGCKT